MIGSACLAWTVQYGRMSSQLRFLVATGGFLGAGQLRYTGVVVVE